MTSQTGLQCWGEEFVSSLGLASSSRAKATEGSRRANGHVGPS